MSRVQIEGLPPFEANKTGYSGRSFFLFPCNIVKNYQRVECGGIFVLQRGACDVSKLPKDYDADELSYEPDTVYQSRLRKTTWKKN
jgi:hypothetical protein